MSTKLCSIELKVKDYLTNEEGSFSYHGEVVVIDYDLRQYDFRFYDTDAGTLLVSIDASKDICKVVEQNDNINLQMNLKKDEIHPCIYRLDKSNALLLETKAFGLDFIDNQIILEYDLFDKNDVEHVNPLTRNIVKIDFEGEKAC